MPLSLPRIGALSADACNSISNVAGVAVGHATTTNGDTQTGVMVIRPHAGDPFVDKVPAASMVLNGLGKSTSLVQVDELGVLETPIALTNTFAVGAVAQTQIRQAVVANPRIGRAWSTVNPFVFECNDGYLNDLQAFAVWEVYYDATYAAAAQVFEQGAVEAGCGMSSFGMKGGIGSASRVVTLVSGAQRTADAFALSNFGVAKNLTLDGRSVGVELVSASAVATPEPEKGPITMLIVIDAPPGARQLRRLASCAGTGLARTGFVFGHDSGNIALAFSTAYTVPHEGARTMPAVSMTHGSHLDPLFRTAADSVEQATVHVLFHATTVTGRNDNIRRALTELL